MGYFGHLTPPVEIEGGYQFFTLPVNNQVPFEPHQLSKASEVCHLLFSSTPKLGKEIFHQNVHSCLFLTLFPGPTMHGTVNKPKLNSNPHSLGPFLCHVQAGYCVRLRLSLILRGSWIGLVRYRVDSLRV